jgi:hypothetical protein
LGERGIFKRIVESAKINQDSSYWLGRAARVYLSTVVFNLRTKRPFTAISRAIYCGLILAAAGIRLTTSAFWQGVMAHHAPGTLHYISKKYEQDSNQETLLAGEAFQ